jgi:hypothetical protein
MTSLVQRWRERRDLYRPAGEVIQPSRYDVEPLDKATAKKAQCLMMPSSRRAQGRSPCGP